MSDTLYKLCEEHNHSVICFYKCDICERDDEIRQLKHEREELVDFLLSSDHQAGCNGGFGENYSCKCGFESLRKKYELSNESEASDETMEDDVENRRA